MKSQLSAALLAGAIVLSSVSNARADDDRQRGCSVATLRGSFGYTVTGEIVGGPSAGPFGAVGILTFDGKGNFENVRTISRNGAISRQVQGIGTYIVNADCSGSLVFVDGGVVTLGTDLVIDDDGKELRMIATSQGTVLTVTGRRQFSQRDR